jgi:hypothetical protein
VSRKTRELPEMVEALARQVRLLDAYVKRAQSDPDYWGEVASKLRLLIIERARNNRALLLRVADEYDARLRFGSSRPDGGPLTWDEFLDRQMLGQGERSITFREVICRWAEQMGGAHEDWSVDEMLLKTHTTRGRRAETANSSRSGI